LSSYIVRVNFNVYLDNDTARRLEAMARSTGTPRNAIVREAIAAWLERAGRSWPALVLEFEGDSEIAPFEASRSEFRPPVEDPFAVTAVQDRRRGRRR
jgi:hypothetical protein